MEYIWFKNNTNETLYRVNDNTLEFTVDFLVKENDHRWFKSTLTRDQFFGKVNDEYIDWISEPVKE